MLQYNEASAMGAMPPVAYPETAPALLSRERSSTLTRLGTTRTFTIAECFELCAEINELKLKITVLTKENEELRNKLEMQTEKTNTCQ